MIEYTIFLCFVAIVFLGVQLYKLTNRLKDYCYSMDNKLYNLKDKIGELNIKETKQDILISSTTSFSESTRENLDLLISELGYKVVNKGKQIEKVINEI